MHVDNEFLVLLIKCKLHKGRNLVCHIHYWIFLSSRTISGIWKRLNSIRINAWFFLSLMVNPVYLLNFTLTLLCYKVLLILLLLRQYFKMEKQCLYISEWHNEVANACQWQKDQERKCFFHLKHIWNDKKLMIFQTTNYKHYQTYISTFINSFLRLKIVPHFKFSSLFIRIGLNSLLHIVFISTTAIKYYFLMKHCLFIKRNW